MKVDLKRDRVFGFLLIMVSLAELTLAAFGPIALGALELKTLPPLLFFGAGALVGLRFGSRPAVVSEAKAARLLGVTEAVFVFGLILLWFEYIFAANANMDYVQRFMASGGDLRLAIDTATERRAVALRYGPLLAATLALYLRLAVRLRRYELLLTLVSVGLTVLSFPSAVDISGLGFLGWVALSPLIYLLWRGRYGAILFYGTTYGVLATLLTNFWLGTFSLVSLMVVVVIYLGIYGVFMALFGAVVRIFRDSGPSLRVFITAAAWTIFELLRSSGFLGYPWALVAHSQYENAALIQISELTGVWGVSFVVVLVSATLAELGGPVAARLIDRHNARKRKRSAGLAQLLAPRRPMLIAVVIVVAAAHLYGLSTLVLENRYPEADTTARIALIQQNSDPRKNDYARTFQTLRDLTDRALQQDPDLVVWSETAFVPNIRRWSRVDPDRNRLARLVAEFQEYQASIDTWLLTGNDDYRRVLNDEGREIDRLSYNASVLFSDTGKRMNTYHKIRLVPFTEYFPYEEELPFVYEALQEYDVTFWEPGRERTVFEHPELSFSTPICFEDTFPGGARQFVRNGAEVILNITNDYWSLTKVQAQQHFAASLFRAVENRRPLLRATASGVTAYVDPYGEVESRLPQYTQAFLVADVPVSRGDTFTIYTRFGDWFPVSAGLSIPVLMMAGMVRRRYAGRGRNVRR